MSAKIYQFPSKGRFATGVLRTESKPEANMISPRGAKVVYGSNWYHDEAIQEADQLHKN
jgi:hypothetical protein